MRPDYPVIDAHVHIMPWEQVRPDAAARMAAGRKDFDEIQAICRDPYRLMAHMDERGIEKLVMINTGTSIFPRARNKYGDPLDIDDVIVDFPELKVILAHGGRPLWMDTALFLLRRSRNVILDISSVPPKNLLTYFPWLERVADQAIFGSDWPGPNVMDLGQNVEDFYALPLSAEAKRKILRDNAKLIFDW